MISFCSTPHRGANGHSKRAGNPSVAQKHLGGCYKPVELRAALRCSELYRWAAVSPEFQRGQRWGKSTFVHFLSICHLHRRSQRVKFTSRVTWTQPVISGWIWPGIYILLVPGRHYKLNHRCLVTNLMMYFKPFALRTGWLSFLFSVSTAPSRKDFYHCKWCFYSNMQSSQQTGLYAANLGGRMKFQSDNSLKII